MKPLLESPKEFIVREFQSRNKQRRKWHLRESVRRAQRVKGGPQKNTRQITKVESETVGLE